MALDHQVGIGDAERLQVGDGVGAALVFWTMWSTSRARWCVDC